ncbi:hypothetical protein [Photobacterium leiognathi]|uniref:hypothetical protein n=1 Tax=Photobacterium leiognathi TaxID=553611 RepID=UPI002739FB7B|nr:hypothetical protein [Photobacterium leiognathi]
MSDKKTNDQFIKEAIAIWGDRFDFSKVVYTGSKEKVTLVCNQHNIEFEVLGNSVLHGKTLCPKCRQKFTQNLSINQFIIASRSVWGDQFDYSKTAYTNNKNKVTILCRKHNCEFHQIAGSHLYGRNGCPHCNSKNMNTEKFIARATAKWGNKFDYSKVLYTKSCNKITLICRKHGYEFKQIANSHMQMKEGCPECDKLNRKRKHKFRLLSYE